MARATPASPRSAVTYGAHAAASDSRRLRRSRACIDELTPMAGGTRDLRQRRARRRRRGRALRHAMRGEPATGVRVRYAVGPRLPQPLRAHAGRARLASRASSSMCGLYLICSTHGATYAPDIGPLRRGPCRGAARAGRRRGARRPGLLQASHMRRQTDWERACSRSSRGRSRSSGARAAGAFSSSCSAFAYLFVAAVASASAGSRAQDTSARASTRRWSTSKGVIARDGNASADNVTDGAAGCVQGQEHAGRDPAHQQPRRQPGAGGLHQRRDPPPARPSIPTSRSTPWSRTSAPRAATTSRSRPTRSTSTRRASSARSAC